MTIRERITAIQRQLRDETVTPQLAREALMTLTALLGNVLDECREADFAYIDVYEALIQSEGKATVAKARGQKTAEYRRARTAEDTKELTAELIRSCKVYLRSLDTEMGLSR